MRLCFLIVLFFWLPVSGSALEVPPPPTSYVYDSAQLLTPAIKTAMEEILSEYEAKTTNQLVVATFPSLENDSLESFSIRLADQWKMGRADRDNGIILLVFKEDRKVRIEVGYGLEGIFPDALAGQVIQQQIIPAFKQGDYNLGLSDGVAAIIRLTSDPVGPAPPPSRPPSPELPIRFILIFMAAVLALDLLRFFDYGRQHRHSSHYGFWEWFFRFAILFFIINIVFRILLAMATHSRGSYYGSRSGHGGFSGGGGSFGGGGASGSW